MRRRKNIHPAERFWLTWATCTFLFFLFLRVVEVQRAAHTVIHHAVSDTCQFLRIWHQILPCRALKKNHRRLPWGVQHHTFLAAQSTQWTDLGLQLHFILKDPGRTQKSHKPLQIASSAAVVEMPVLPFMRQANTASVLVQYFSCYTTSACQFFGLLRPVFLSLWTPQWQEHGWDRLGRGSKPVLCYCLIAKSRDGLHKV